jgi:hypothetical protein
MRILVAIPHYFVGESSGKTKTHRSLAGNPAPRIAALSQCIHALHQLYGSTQYVMQLARRRTQPANVPFHGEVHVVVCTTGGRHLLDRLPVDPAFYYHQPTQAEPRLLGYECQAVLRDRWGNYDYYCCLEDDLVLHDPWFFRKLAWFTEYVGEDSLLLPNRFERGRRPLAVKAYVDGDLAEHVTARFQNVKEQPQLRSTVMGIPLVFRRPLNPHSGCYFLTREQMAHWTRQTYFLDRSTAFIGPLESAATLGIMRAFKIYKPARENANFLEIEHHGDQFVGQLRRPKDPT